MPDAEIRETTITPDADGAIVRLEISDSRLPISDAPLADEHIAAIRVTVEAKLPAYERPLLLAQAQRETVKIAQTALNKLLSGLKDEIAGVTAAEVDPKPRR